MVVVERKKENMIIPMKILWIPLHDNSRLNNPIWWVYLSIYLLTYLLAYFNCFYYTVLLWWNVPYTYDSMYEWMNERVWCESGTNRKGVIAYNRLLVVTKKTQSSKFSDSSLHFISFIYLFISFSYTSTDLLLWVILLCLYYAITDLLFSDYSLHVILFHLFSFLFIY